MLYLLYKKNYKRKTNATDERANEIAITLSPFIFPEVVTITDENWGKERDSPFFETIWKEEGRLSLSE